MTSPFCWFAPGSVPERVAAKGLKNPMMTLLNRTGWAATSHLIQGLERESQRAAAERSRGNQREARLKTRSPEFLTNKTPLETMPEKWASPGKVGSFSQLQQRKRSGQCTATTNSVLGTAPQNENGSYLQHRCLFQKLWPQKEKVRRQGKNSQLNASMFPLFPPVFNKSSNSDVMKVLMLTSLFFLNFEPF